MTAPSESSPLRALAEPKTGLCEVAFNRRPMIVGDRIEEPSDDLVRSTLGLVNASPEDAVRYGGDITRAALGAMKIRNDRRYVVVDVKTHMLMKGMSPAIPGWHTDSAPRDETGNPQGSGPPSLALQEEIDAAGRATHFHLLVTGDGCLTEFYTLSHAVLRVPLADTSLYATMSEQVRESRGEGGARTWAPRQFQFAPSCTVVEWDWWNVHRGVPATLREWRYLIRVTETDFLPPDTDLRRVIRTQQQVYAPATFGW